MYTCTQVLDWNSWIDLLPPLESNCINVEHCFNCRASLTFWRMMLVTLQEQHLSEKWTLFNLMFCSIFTSVVMKRNDHIAASIYIYIYHRIRLNTVQNVWLLINHNDLRQLCWPEWNGWSTLWRLQWLCWIFQDLQTRCSRWHNIVFGNIWINLLRKYWGKIFIFVSVCINEAKYFSNTI